MLLLFFPLLSLDVLDGKQPDFSKVYHGYVAQSDNPGSILVPEYIKQFPDVKVVHTIRDSPDKWVASARETIFQSGIKSFCGYHELLELGWPDRMILFVLRGMAKMMLPMFDVWFGTDLRLVLAKQGWRAAARKLQEIINDDAFLIATYEAWNEKIKKTVKPENLLVFNVKQGWQPLCDFLEVPIPLKKFPLIRETVQLEPMPFPNVNDTAEFKKRLKGIDTYVAVAKGIAYAVRIGLIVGVAYAALKFIR